MFWGRLGQKAYHTYNYNIGTFKTKIKWGSRNTEQSTFKSLLEGYLTPQTVDSTLLTCCKGCF